MHPLGKLIHDPEGESTISPSVSNFAGVSRSAGIAFGSGVVRGSPGPGRHHDDVTRREARKRTLDLFREVDIPDPERRIDVNWDTDADVSHRIRIRVTSRDAPGLLAEITRSISAAGVNIGAARVATHPDRTATQNFDLWITDVRVLNKVMKEIERVKGVLSVERIRA